MEAVINTRDAYQRAESTLREHCLKVGILLLMSLIPAGALVDYILYQPLFHTFLKIRLGIDGVLVAMLVLLFTPWGSRYSRFCSLASPLIINLGTALMIFLSNGPLSPYYASLSLVIFALAVLMPWTFRETLIVSLTTLGIYFIACMLHTLYKAPLEDPGIFYHHLIFLGLTGIICAVAVNYKSQFQIREFLRRHELNEHNKELWATLRSLEETESQRERLRSLGSVAAEHIHEINNPLNFTSMAVKACRESASANDPAFKESLKDIDEGIRRIRNIVGDLRAFAVPDVNLQCESFSFGSALESALRLLSSKLEGITIVRNFNDGYMISGTKTQVVHVLMNLIQNAVQAIRTTKRKSRSSRTGPAVIPCIEISTTEVDNNRLRVNVKDNGSGIDPDVLSKMFDPFFTTRQGGEGLGLGLSISRSMIKDHGGVITALSKKGEGTEVIFDLPLAQKN